MPSGRLTGVCTVGAAPQFFAYCRMTQSKALSELNCAVASEHCYINRSLRNSDGITTEIELESRRYYGGEEASRSTSNRGQQLQLVKSKHMTCAGYHDSRADSIRHCYQRHWATGGFVSLNEASTEFVRCVASFQVVESDAMKNVAQLQVAEASAQVRHARFAQSLSLSLANHNQMSFCRQVDFTKTLQAHGLFLFLEGYCYATAML